MIFIILISIAALALLAALCGAAKGVGLALTAITVAGALKAVAWALAC